MTTTKKVTPKAPTKTALLNAVSNTEIRKAVTSASNGYHKVLKAGETADKNYAILGGMLNGLSAHFSHLKGNASIEEQAKTLGIPLTVATEINNARLALKALTGSDAPYQNVSTYCLHYDGAKTAQHPKRKEQAKKDAVKKEVQAKKAKASKDQPANVVKELDTMLLAAFVRGTGIEGTSKDLQRRIEFIAEYCAEFGIKAE